jgi:ribose transport system permease protein
MTETPQAAEAPATRASTVSKPRLLPALGLAAERLRRYLGVIAAICIACVYLGITQPVFLEWSNWQNIIRSQSVVLVLALGATMVVITAGIDLSAAAATVVASMVLGVTIQAGAGWLLACLATAGAGLGLGFVNGFLIGKVKISLLVVTLGTLSIYQSVAYLITGGETLSLLGSRNFDEIDTLVNGSVGPIPTILVISIGLYGLTAALLHLTSFGRALFAVGANPEAARLVGINVGTVLVATYTLAGLFAGLAGIVNAGRLTAAGPQVDPNLLLMALTAVLIGGTSFTGGEGGVLGTALGVLFLGVIQNALQLRNVSAFWQGTISGTILIAAVGISLLRGGRLWRARPTWMRGDGRWWRD